MSNYLAIATVTATLQRLLQASIQADVSGARVTTIRPEYLESGAPESGVNLFLYQIETNPAWGNSHTPARQRRGEVSRQSQAALDLHYLFSFYGNDVELEPQRLLGSVIRTLEDSGNLTADLIRDTTTDSSYAYLADSDLADQPDAIRVEMGDLDLEDMTGLWGSFFQIPYVLSVAYKVTVVLLEGDTPAERALPVGSTQPSLAPFGNRPVVSQVLPAAGRYQPVARNSILIIRGRNLAAAQTRVRIGSVLVTPPRVSNAQIVLPLELVPSEALRAGVQSVQVVHQSQAVSPVERRRAQPANGSGALSTLRETQPALAIESNVEAFVLRPTIVTLAARDLEESDREGFDGRIEVTADLTIGAAQSVALCSTSGLPANPRPISLRRANVKKTVLRW
ncbi:MAG: DUF4255 domain-containing protein [Spirulinaceae cyanobacterium RM2_2_10]|nr:DUF4255 domain-containing protein [Spirulinaceae cyanobacterium RM2_2_10]